MTGGAYEIASRMGLVSLSRLRAVAAGLGAVEVGPGESAFEHRHGDHGAFRRQVLTSSAASAAQAAAGEQVLSMLEQLSSGPGEELEIQVKKRGSRRTQVRGPCLWVGTATLPRNPF